MNLSVSRSMVDRSLRDKKFKQNFPEFNGLKTPTMWGCPTCKRSKAEMEPQVQLTVFIRIIESLGAAKLAAFKKYFNAEHLQYRLNNEVRKL